MAVTRVGTSDALAKKLWEEKLYRELKKESFFDAFSSEGGDNIVHVKMDLSKGRGDKITIPLRARATGGGVQGDAQLLGNEEKLTLYNFAVTVDKYRHAVRIEKELSEQRTPFSLSAEAEAAIKDWGAEKIDQLHFDALTASDPTQAVYLDSTGEPKFTTTASTAKGGLDATNSKINTKLISFAKQIAKNGNNRTFWPIRPVRVEGKNMYVLLTSLEVEYDLKQDSAFQQALREAEVRGKDNPLFRSAFAIWDNVIVMSHENIVPFEDGGGGSVHGAQCWLLGAQALCTAWAKKPRPVKESIDYDDQEGTAVTMMLGVGRSQFNSKDFGSLAVYVSSTNF